MDVSAKETGAPKSSIPIPHKPSLEAWLDDWMEGKTSGMKYGVNGGITRRYRRTALREAAERQYRSPHGDH